MNKPRIGIAGGAGYTGGELIRLLVHHPEVELAWVHSHSQAGKPISAVHDDLAGILDMLFTDRFSWDIDLLFLCVGHGEARKFLQSHDVPVEVRIIDLSQDFRLPEQSVWHEREFVYGLPEANRAAIQTAHQVANPGCFATAIQLALLPLAANQALTTTYVTGITGSTGAGQQPSATSHFSWRASNIQAYKTRTHQHLAEIQATLQQVQSVELDANAIRFVPWRGDFTRGIFISAQVTVKESAETIASWYENYYNDHPYTKLVWEPLHLKQVVNTNRCLIQLEQFDDQLVVHAAIDNLLKGASGQALQNMNLMFGFPETTGLHLKANYF